MRGVDAIPAATLGKFLSEAGILSEADLEEATQSMVLFGGRLGTSLIEAGILTLRELEEQLAAYHGLQPVPEEWIEHPDPGARAMLSAELIQRYSAFPLWFDKRTLHIGFLDPMDEAVIDEICFATGCTVVRYVLPECRFAWIMEKGFGIKPDLRFSNLMLEAETAREQRANPRPPTPAPVVHERFDVEPLAAELDLIEELPIEPAPASGPTTPSPSPLAADTQTNLTPSEETTAPTTQEAVAEPPASAASESPTQAWELPDTDAPSEPVAEGPVAPRPSPVEISNLQQVLLETPQRGDIIRAAVRIASGYAEFAALFVVRSDMATGACAWRDGDWIEIDDVAVPTLHGNVLAEAANEKRIVRAKPETQIDRQLATALGRENTHEFAAIPIMLGGRIVNLLLVDGATAPISEPAMKALGQLGPMVAAAYERLIVARKQQAGSGG